MKEDLIIKWLNDELTAEELEGFKKSDEYTSYIRISEAANHFKSPDFDQQKQFKELKLTTSSTQKNSKTPYLRYIAAIAAVFLVVFMLFKNLGTNSEVESYRTLTASIEDISLPDQSKVSLNANSQLDYNSNEWKDNRELELRGEAYFKVQKGSKFTVNTDYGNVEVLGTIFNVKARDYAFEVTCYEGSVGVKIDDKSFVLKMNDKLLLESNDITLIKSNNLKPDWKNQKSILKSQPLEKVLKEFQNYYDVEFTTNGVDTSRLFSGSFTHNDMEIALNSITLPLGLTYRVDDKKIFLSKK